MARIRSIKPDFFTSEQVADCSLAARLLFIGMWCFCDDNGVHPASAARLKMEVFPGDDITKAQIAALVGELIDVGLIKEYAVNGERYWLVTGWKHQKIEKPSYKFPLPTDEIRPLVAHLSPTGSEPVAEQSPNSRRPFDDASPPEGKGVEGSGEEEKKNTLVAVEPGDGVSNPGSGDQIAPADPPPVDPPSPPLGVRDLIAEGVGRLHAEDWLKARRAKRAPLTCTAWNDVKAEAAKAGIGIDDAIRIAATNSWQGFRASWLAKLGTEGGATGDADKPKWATTQEMTL